jgi:hypothetical protein
METRMARRRLQGMKIIQEVDAPSFSASSPLAQMPTFGHFLPISHGRFRAAALQR